MVYGGITSFPPTRFKRIKHRRKTPSLDTMSTASLGVLEGYPTESPATGSVGIGVCSEDELRGEMGRGKGACSAKFSWLMSSGRVGRVNSS